MALEAALEHVRQAFEEELANEREIHAQEVEAVRREHQGVVDRLVEENRRLVEERNALLAQMTHARPSRSASTSSSTSVASSRPPPLPGTIDQHSPRGLKDPYRYRIGETNSHTWSPRQREGPATSRGRHLAHNGRLRPPELVHLETESTNHHAELLAEIDERLSARQSAYPHTLGRTAPRVSTTAPSSPLSLSYSSATSLGRASKSKSPTIPVSPHGSVDPEELSRRGREFFGKARTLLSEDQFAQLLSSMKELNRGHVTREDVVATAAVLLREAEAPELVDTFELLLQGQIPA